MEKLYPILYQISEKFELESDLEDKGFRPYFGKESRDRNFDLDIQEDSQKKSPKCG